jgi:hypothetical protein
MKILDIPRSGRDGRWVYYMQGSKLFRRKYVIPKDPRTTGQLRARAALTAASKAWSHSPQLTEEHRQGWRVAGAKVWSRPRLYQSGPLTGQMYFVARNYSRDRAGRELLLRATDPVGQGSEGRRQPAEAASQCPQCQRVARSTWEQYRIYTGGTPSQYRGNTPHGPGTAVLRNRPCPTGAPVSDEAGSLANLAGGWVRSLPANPLFKGGQDKAFQGSDC